MHEYAESFLFIEGCTNVFYHKLTFGSFREIALLVWSLSKLHLFSKISTCRALISSCVNSTRAIFQTVSWPALQSCQCNGVWSGTNPECYNSCLEPPPQSHSSTLPSMEKTCRLGRNQSSIWHQELRKSIDQILPPSFCSPRRPGAERAALCRNKLLPPRRTRLDSLRVDQWIARAIYLVEEGAHSPVFHLLSHLVFPPNNFLFLAWYFS